MNRGRVQFRLFHHQHRVAWARDHGEHAQWRDWLSWVHERFGFEE